MGGFALDVEAIGKSSESGIASELCEECPLEMFGLTQRHLVLST